jgi:hypothetical protein
LERDEDSVRKAVDEGEGCRLEGFLDVAKVVKIYWGFMNRCREISIYLIMLIEICWNISLSINNSL